MEATQYWLVGATWSGEDQAQAFFNRGYWEIGYSDTDQPGFAEKRNLMHKGDRVALKKSGGARSPNITVRGLGTVKDIGDDGKVYIHWLITDLEREVESKGCYKTIHGPFEFATYDGWVQKVFCI
jgi:hypothetical protein